jgi:hypothetical protein
MFRGSRAAALYTALCGEDPEDERLWIGLFRVYERAGDLLGLGRAERQLRQSLVELAPTSVNVNPDTVTRPPKLDRLLQDIRLRLSEPSSAPTSEAGGNARSTSAKSASAGLAKLGTGALQISFTRVMLEMAACA